MIRYAITAIKKDGMRALALHNWNTNHRDTREEAVKQLDEILSANNADTINDLLGKDLRVDPIECYGSGDAIGIYVKK